MLRWTSLTNFLEPEKSQPSWRFLGQEQDNGPYCGATLCLLETQCHVNLGLRLGPDDERLCWIHQYTSTRPGSRWRCWWPRHALLLLEAIPIVYLGLQQHAAGLFLGFDGYAGHSSLAILSL